MSETFMTAIGIIIAIVIMFATPIMAIATQNDDITQTSVQSIINNFVNTVAKEGKITQNSYDALIQNLYATGNAYDVELEVQIISDNLPKQVSIYDKDKQTNIIKEQPEPITIGESLYYSTFTKDIVKKLEDDKIYKLTKGSRVIVRVKNINQTMGTTIKNFLYSVIGKEIVAIKASATALVSTTGK